MVQLKASTYRLKPAPLLFQFLYGTIKSLATRIYLGGVPVFQFLYGTIKSERDFRNIKSEFLFQFLYGTIKRRHSHRKEGPVKRFNSSMVQLKVAIRDEPAKQHTGFNSSMVQLKDYAAPLGEYANGCFNSSMVQLKENALDRSIIRGYVSIPLWYN